MRDSIRTSVLALGLAAALSACGKDEEKTSSTATRPASPTGKLAAALEGEGWIGTAVDPTAPTGRVRALAFFKPG